MKLPAYSVYRWLWQMVDWIYPPSCYGCNQAGDLLCSDCSQSIQYLQNGLCSRCGYPRMNRRICAGCSNHSPYYTQIRSVAAYTGCIKEGVHQLKYQNNLGLGIHFANYIYQLIKQQNWQIDLVIPVPLSPNRRKERGYNQTTMIAFPLSLQLGCKMDDKLIKRVKETQTQIELDAHQRQINLQNAFQARSTRGTGKNILVVDDVITTGATINDCARALKSAGAKEVYAVSIGRVVLNP
jgi:competence protein ComFC